LLCNLRRQRSNANWICCASINEYTICTLSLNTPTQPSTRMASIGPLYALHRLSSGSWLTSTAYDFNHPPNQKESKH
jgi:hypothetical protein